VIFWNPKIGKCVFLDVVFFISRPRTKCFQISFFCWKAEVLDLLKEYLKISQFEKSTDKIAITCGCFYFLLSFIGPDLNKRDLVVVGMEKIANSEGVLVKFQNIKVFKKSENETPKISTRDLQNFDLEVFSGFLGSRTTKISNVKHQYVLM